uniref:Acyltransferase 3 domain-containing protein n=1 Tax=Heliothis virescens TaxID=7102 RepID=A0A2A4JFY4_HELVI
MQLYITALVVFLACRTPRVRKVTLSVLFVVATVVPALHTYHQKLDGVLVVYPEFLVKIFMDNPTFDFIYKRGHTNLIGYVVGMSMGYMVYAWQKAGGDPKNLRKYRFIYWTLFPMGCLCCYTGRLYYTHAPPPNMFIDIMFAAFMKPVFSIVIGTVIVGVVIQFENLYWSAVAWRGWTIPSRLSFSAYLLHIGFARNNVAAITTVSRTSLWMMLLCALRVTIVSFISAIVFWLMVETPLNNVVKEFFSGQKAIKEDKTEPSVDKHEHIEDKIAKDTSEILEKIENNNVFMRKRLVRSNLYWSAVAWRGWTIPSRLSFSAYLLHIGFARNNVAAITTVSRTSLWMMLLCALRVTIVSFISAIVFWLMVETPLNNVVKEFFSGQKAIKEDKTEPSVDKHEHIEDKIAKDTSEILEKIENNNVFMRKRLVRSS